MFRGKGNVFSQQDHSLHKYEYEDAIDKFNFMNLCSQSETWSFEGDQEKKWCYKYHRAILHNRKFLKKLNYLF